MKKINIKLLAICIAIPLIIGAISAFLSMSGMKEFEMVNKPPLTHFGVVISRSLDHIIYYDGSGILSRVDG